MLQDPDISNWYDFETSFVDEVPGTGTEDKESNDSDEGEKPSFTHLSSEVIIRLSWCSVSRKNFAAYLPGKVLTVGERTVKRVQGKSQLDPE